jgi:DNA polymerase III delta subunit
MDTKMAEQLIIACDNNYGLIVNEIDKVKYSDISIIEELIENSKTYEAYNAVQMLLAKDKDTMKYLINLLEAEQGNELGILGLLFNRASQLLQLQQGVLPPELNDWQAKKLMKINRLNQRDLYRATRWCRIYSEGIKNGEYLPYDAVLLCFMKILK